MHFLHWHASIFPDGIVVAKMRNDNRDKGEKAKTIIGQIGQAKEYWKKKDKYPEKDLFLNGAENVSEEDFMETALSESEAEDSYPRFDCMLLSEEEVGEDIAYSDKLRYIKAVEIMPGVKYKRGKIKDWISEKSETICSTEENAYVSHKDEEIDADESKIEDKQMNDFFFNICKSNGKRFDEYSVKCKEDLFSILALKSRGLLYSHTYPYSDTLWVFPTKLGISYYKEQTGNKEEVKERRTTDGASRFGDIFGNKGREAGSDQNKSFSGFQKQAKIRREQDYPNKSMVKENYEVFQNEEQNAILNVLMKYLKSKGYEVQPGKHRVMCYKMFGRYQINYGAPHYFSNRKFLEKLSKETKNIIYLAFTLEDKAFVQGRVANWIYQNFGGLEYFFEEGYGYAVCTINDILEAYDFPRRFTSTMNLYDITKEKSIPNV